MVHRFWCALVIAAAGTLASLGMSGEAEAQAPYNQHYARTYNTMDWMRFYHYPYVYYPQNFYNQEYYKSSESLYYRYPQEMRIPVYNKQWQNYYPQTRRYHHGHHFIMDVF